MANSVKATFKGSRGTMLAARLDMPSGPPVAYALFAHCFTCSKDIYAASRIAGALAQRGIAVLRFDFTGLGASEGEFANTDFSSNVADLVAAADWLRENHTAPRLLIGHSLGGAAVLAAAARIAETTSVATIGAPAEPAHLRHLLQTSAEEIERTGEAEIVISGRTFRVRREFLQDIAAQNLKRAIHGLRRGLLVLHSPVDEVVGIDNASEIFLAALHPKSFVSLDRADHLLRRREDAIYAADVIAAWAEHYLDTLAPADVPAAEGVLVVENGLGKLSQDVIVGRHLLHADEPVAAGGDDTGPNPYDHLAAALGACTTMTMRLYAERKGWPLARASVRVKHGKMHAEDCAECETREGKVDLLTREISLEGPLDAEQRTRLVEIAEKCPVHRTLHSEIVVRTTLKDAG